MRRIVTPTSPESMMRNRGSRSRHISHCGSCCINVLKPIDTSPTITVTQSQPFIEGFTGEASPTISNPFNSFRISKPGCCDLVIVTDFGTFPMPSWMTEFSSCDFQSDVLFTSIELQGSAECIETTSIYVSGTVDVEVEVENPNAEPCVPPPIPDTPPLGNPCAC